MLALSAGDVLVQIVICVMVVALYHIMTAGSRATGVPDTAPKPASTPRTETPVVLVAQKSSVETPKPTIAEAPRVASEHVNTGAGVSDAIPAEIIAVIAAAISSVLDRPHRVLSVLPVVPAASAPSAWAHEGRTEIFQSHRVR